MEMALVGQASAQTLHPSGHFDESIIGRPVRYLPEVMSEEVKAAAAALKPGEILLLENTRFHPGEKKNDPQLAADFASLADVYVDDAFGSAHRPDASVDGVAHAMRAKGGPAVSGFLMNAEIAALSEAVENPPHPYVAIMGGAKISDKIKLIENLLDRADKILIGGGMANTFLKAQGADMGKSLAKINLGLTRASPGSITHAQLLDDRDRTLEGMSALVDVNVSLDQYGRATVRAGIAPGAVITDVENAHRITLARGSEGKVTLLVHDGGDPTEIRPGGGAMAGLADGSERIYEARTRLDTIATDFVADIKKLNVELDPLTGDRVQELIARTLAAPASVRERAKVAFGR